LRKYVAIKLIWKE